jgi:hypothetical protein
MIHKNISSFHGPSNSNVHCETQIDYCSPNLCLNGGSCSKWGFFGYKCLCSANYTGENCQNINYFNGVQTCLNGGVCKSRRKTYECEWYGIPVQIVKL